MALAKESLSKDEILERMERLSEDSEIALKAIEFLSDVYFGGAFLLSNLLPCVDEDLFCDFDWRRQDYVRVLDLTMTYFYKPTVRYVLQDLTSKIEREFARTWIGFPEGFVRRYCERLLHSAFKKWKTAT